MRTRGNKKLELVWGQFVRGEEELLEALKELRAAFFLNVSALKRDFERALASG